MRRSTAFGTHNAPSYNLEELQDFLEEPIFIGFDILIWVGTRCTATDP